MPKLRATAIIAGRPLHGLLAPFVAACFVLTLISDLAYWASAQMQWANMSAWLLTIGLVAAVFAVLAGLFEVFADGHVLALPSLYLHAIGNAAVLALAILNLLIHSRDAYTSVVPTGLILSFLTVAVLVFTGWLGWGLAHRRDLDASAEGGQ